MNNKEVINDDIKKRVISLAWPVFFSSIFQELYNITNSIIVGNYISLTALSAVSACTWICNIFSYLFYGLGMGSGILVAKYYGAKNTEKLNTTIKTTIIFGILGGICLTIISELSLPMLMRICNISSDIYAQAHSYLRVYLLGITPMMTYQFCFYILRSLGDSKHPLYYLIVSCFTNISLGLIFVRVCNLDIIGTALATCLSQLLVDILCFRLLIKKKEIKLNLKKIDFSFETIKEIFRLGIPAGFQNLLIAFSSMMIQSKVNLFPNEVISAVGVAEKVAAWGQMGSIALSSSLMVIVSQYLGANKQDKARDTIKYAIKISTLITFISVILLNIFAYPIVSLFNDSLLVRQYGSEMIHCMSFSYMLLNLSHIYNASLRGSGNVRNPMIIAVVTQVICKYIFVMIGLKINFSQWIIYFGSAVGYSLAGIAASVYFNFAPYSLEVGLREEKYESRRFRNR